MTRKILAASLCALALASGSAHAALIADPGTIDPFAVVDFEQFSFEDGTGLQGITGPVSVGHGVTFTSTPTSFLGDGTGFTDLGTNGFWSAGKRFAGSEMTPSTLTFTLSSAVSAIGAFVNYYRPGAGVGSILISALDRDGFILESASVTVNTTGGINEGAFYGFKRSSADIYGFALTDGYIVVDDLAFSAPVPEPSTWMLMLLGLGAIAFSATRRRRH